MKIDTKQLVYMAVLIALNIILSRFLSIAAWNFKIGFAFLPVVLAALWLGPIQAALVAALGDFIGATLFPIGQYFFGFTLTAFLVALVYGLFLHKQQTMVRIIMAVLITEVVGSLLLNTLWIDILYGSESYLLLMLSRVPQCIIMFVVEVISIRVLSGCAPRLKKAISHS